MDVKELTNQQFMLVFTKAIHDQFLKLFLAPRANLLLNRLQPTRHGARQVHGGYLDPAAAWNEVHLKII